MTGTKQLLDPTLTMGLENLRVCFLAF